MDGGTPSLIFSVLLLWVVVEEEKASWSYARQT
jgi:hypothetical protein